MKGAPADKQIFAAAYLHGTKTYSVCAIGTRCLCWGETASQDISKTCDDPYQ